MKRIYTSIDVGSYSIKIIVSENVNGKFHVLAATNTRSRGIEKGIIVDKEEFISSLLKAKKNIEEMINIELDQALLILPSSGVDFNIVSDTIEFKEEKEITNNDINYLFNRITKENKSDSSEIINVSPISFHIDDGEGIKNPIGISGNKLSVKAVIMTNPKEYLKLITVLFRECGLEIIDVGYQTLGDYYYVKNKDLDKEKVAIINIGHEIIEIAIFNKGIMIKNERIDFGSKIIEQDIARIYRLKKGFARSLKENFAVSNTRYATTTDIINVTDRTGANIVINQLEISEIVEARIVEMLKLAKKQINILTNQEISYIIITGGISELAGFQYVVENVFDRRASTMSIGTIGVRSNVYSSALGIIKYFEKKQEASNKEYSMLSEKQASDLVSTKKRSTGHDADNIIGKVFGYFSLD